MSSTNHLWSLERTLNHLQESARVTRKLADECQETILLAAHVITETFKNQKKVLLCGNGGSAADCQHLAAEFVSRLSSDFDRPALPAISLTTNTSYITAYANDFGFEGVFERQLSAIGRPGDLLIAISTSGNSPNVLRAVKRAKNMGINTLALCGDRGQLASIVDAAICVPSHNTQHIQEAHLIIEHILCDVVERQLFSSLGVVNLLRGSSSTSSIQEEQRDY